MAYQIESAVPIRDGIYWIGGDDRTASIFEGAFPIPEGVSYNSYLIVDATSSSTARHASLTPATHPSRPSSGGTSAPPWTAGPWTTS